ncbi:MAG: serine--tRNA ligase, partial [Candidatus Cloacimonetes bacterium]|nr:serine--tRNA ligase [Candidatus Cloacimonadota bacterium]
MLDLKFIRDNAELIETAIINKNEKADIKKVLSLDELKRKIQFEFDQLKSEQNRVSKEIGRLKKDKQDATHLLTNMQEIAEKTKSLSTQLSEVDNELSNQLLTIPNIPHSSVPIGRTSDDNIVVRTVGKDVEKDFELKEHFDLAQNQNLIDFIRGAKITGSGFPVYVDKGALLERALINFMLDYHIQKHSYTEVMVPHIVNRNSMTGTGQLPKLENDMYFLQEEDYFMIPTAEVPVTNLYSNEILSIDKLPTKFICYTPCFRREAGSYGKDT